MGETTEAKMTAATAIGTEVVKKLNWLKDLTHTKEEIDVRKLGARLEAGVDPDSPGIYQWRYERTNLVKQIAERRKLKPPYQVEPTSLGLEVGCDLPKSLFKKLGKDGGFLGELAGEVNKIANDLLTTCAERADYFEGKARDPDADAGAAAKARDDYTRQVVQLQINWEAQSEAIVNDFFTDRIKTFADRNRYVFKTSAKLTFTIAGIAIALVVLGTAATPAAPVVLVPALIGLGVLAMSAGKQIGDLMLTAGAVGVRINQGMGKLEAYWFDEDGKPNKKSVKMMEFGAVLASGLTGGMTELKFPSLSSLLGDCAKMKGKLDGMETKCSSLSVNLNELLDTMQAADKLCDAVWDYVTKDGDQKGEDLRGKLKKAKTTLSDGRNTFVATFDRIVELRSEIDRMRAWNEKVSSKLEEVETCLGTKNYALVAQILSAAALAGIQFASPPHELIEKIMIGAATGIAGFDILRELTPEAIERATH